MTPEETAELEAFAQRQKDELEARLLKDRRPQQQIDWSRKYALARIDEMMADPERALRIYREQHEAGQRERKRYWAKQRN